MAMGIFNRRKEDEAPGNPGPATAPAERDAEFGVPPFRPVLKETPAMTMAPKPTAPATPSVAPRPASLGVPARPQTRTDPAERRTLVVGRGISLQGTVADAERLVVEGTVESQMIHAAELFIASSGVFKGEVEVEDAEILGAFDGTITARGSLTIRSTGRITGVARCRKLSVEEGGQLSGRMEMLSGDTAAPARAPAPAPAPAEA
ncbi:MAG: polymer-forming cytoskeletal protein [Acetobacteraceae bacterium]|nr:polymer-forming cytoskeletal protein [Acetobacteraceae bacterium]